MIKVLAAKEMARIEQLAFQDGESPNQFMQEAAKGIAVAVANYCIEHHLIKTLTVIGGKGNNAGDAYVTAAILTSHGFKVSAFQLAPFEECSPLCQEHGKAFMKQGGSVHFVHSQADLLEIRDGIILDGLLGTGFQGSVEGLFLTMIEHVNASDVPVLSIDIPSGLNGNTGEVLSQAIRADVTLFLELPKTGFFINQGWDHVGTLHPISFGLKQKYIDLAKQDLVMLTKESMQSLLPDVLQSRHKYQSGYVAGLAGSKGMSGAAILAGSAALKTGAGIVHLYHPEGLETEFAALSPELVKRPYSSKDGSMLVKKINEASSGFIGPGMGQSDAVKKLLCELLPQLTTACVIDADALNHIAREDISISSPAVFTPHLGELSRLLQLDATPEKNLALLETCQNYVKEKQHCLLLKGGPTFIFSPNAPIYVNPRGDPGMATAGSGDVLSGMITALLAQKLSLQQAACLGVFLHALAGEYAAQEKTSYSMVATDILNSISFAFKQMISS